MERVEGEELQQYFASIPEATVEELDGVSEGDANVKQWYVRINTERRASGQISGCFEETFSEACESSERRSFQINAILYVDSPGNCDDNQPLHLYTFL